MYTLEATEFLPEAQPVAPLPLVPDFPILARSGFRNSQPEPTVSYIRSVDASLYYEEYGAGEVLVLIPGLFGTIETDWRRFIPELARHFHTLAVDLRGHGKTDNPSGTLRRRQLLDDLHTLLETLEIERAFFCSHGVTAAILAGYASEHPERVLGLILHSPRFLRNDPLHVPDDILLASITPFTADVLSEVHSLANGPDGWERLRAQGRGFLPEIASDATASFGLVRVPLLVTVGGVRDEDDRVRDEAIAYTSPECEITILPRSGRAITAVQKRELVDATVAFIRRATGA